MTFDLSTAVTDGVARVANSLFPTNVNIDSQGYGACRFMLIAGPDGWVAGAWRANPAGGEPLTVVLEPVSRLVAYESRIIDVILVDGRRVQITSDKGCGCGGSKVRMFNPFGQGINIGQVPAPTPDPAP
jgi:hypothetical protein